MATTFYAGQTDYIDKLNLLATANDLADGLANLDASVATAIGLKIDTADKDATGGVPGLTLFKLNMRNAANTITSWFTNAATVARTWTLPDKDGTVAMTSDITGTNSGTNTGDQTSIVGITGTIAQFNTAVTDADLAILAGNTFTGAQIYSDQVHSRAMLQDCGLVFLDKGNSGTSTQTLDYTAGSHQKITATGNHTIATSNWPPTGNLGGILLELVNGGAYTLTWPTINWRKPDGTFTTSISTYLAANTGRVALQSSGTDFIVLWSRDAGTTIYGSLV